MATNDGGSSSSRTVLPFSYRDEYRAAIKGDWNTIQNFFTSDPLAPFSPINISGDTVLHILATNRQIDIIRKVSELSLPAHGLQFQNREGNTSLHEAIRVGSMEIVKLLVAKDVNLVSITNFLEETPLFWAATYGQRVIFHFLLSINKREILFKRNDDSTILHAAVIGEFYELALEIIEMYPVLAFIRNDSGNTALSLIAKSPASFKSGTIYTHKNIGSTSFIPLEMLAILIYKCLPADKHPTKGNTTSGIKGLIKCFPCLKLVDDSKQKHLYAEELVQKLLTSNISSIQQNDIKEPLLEATKHGTVEVVMNILKEFPQAIEFLDDDDKNVLHLSVEYRREQVFEFLKLKNFPISRMVANVDRNGNTALHLAAKLGEQPMYVHGAFQQLPWEMFWFKRIEHISLPHLLHLRNNHGYTAKEIFKESHGNLLKEAERWVTNTANSYMLISTLIASINFTAALTVPGGFNQEKGLPIHLMNKYFAPYVDFLTTALFSSLISLGLAFSSNISRFHDDGYYIFLPSNFLIGGSAFYLSAICTFMAYTFAIYLEEGPLASGWRNILGLTVLVIAHLLTGIIYINVMYPHYLYMIRVILHSLTYTAHRRRS